MEVKFWTEYLLPTPYIPFTKKKKKKSNTRNYLSLEPEVFLLTKEVIPILTGNSMHHQNCFSVCRVLSKVSPCNILPFVTTTADGHTLILGLAFMGYIISLFWWDQRFLLLFYHFCTTVRLSLKIDIDHLLIGQSNNMKQFWLLSSSY